MSSALARDALDEPILAHVRRDVMVLRKGWTIGEALDHIRRNASCGDALYFYVVNGENELIGVLPARRLLVSALEVKVEEVVLDRVVAIPDTFTVLEACEYFVLHRFLAFPVVDAQRQLVGVVDVRMFADELFDLHEREQTDSVFETLGFRLSRLQDGSAWNVFRVRFPWLLATIASGTACALLVSRFEATLAQSLVLAFFMTLVLGLGESVTVQTMTIVIHALRQETPDRVWLFRTLRRELARALLMGLACAAVVAGVVLVWQHDVRAALVIGGGIVGSLLAACGLAVTIPAVLHRFKLDLKIAAGPIALAAADICTILVYFTLATMVL